MDVRHFACRGQIHASLLAVDVIASGVPARQEMAPALRDAARARAI